MTLDVPSWRELWRRVVQLLRAELTDRLEAPTAPAPGLYDRADVDAIMKAHWLEREAAMREMEPPPPIDEEPLAKDCDRELPRVVVQGGDWIALDRAIATRDGFDAVIRIRSRLDCS